MKFVLGLTQSNLVQFPNFFFSWELAKFVKYWIGTHLSIGLCCPLFNIFRQRRTEESSVLFPSWLTNWDLIGLIIAEWRMRNCYFLLDLLIEIRIVWLLLSDLWETTISFLTYWLSFDWFDYIWVTYEKLFFPSWLTDWDLISLIIAEWLMITYYILFDLLIKSWFIWLWLRYELSDCWKPNIFLLTYRLRFDLYIMIMIKIWIEWLLRTYFSFLTYWLRFDLY